MSSLVRSLALVLVGGLGASTLVASTGEEDTGPRPDGPPVVSAPSALDPPLNIAFVANGVSMVDALGAGAAAARLDAPVLVTKQDALVSAARSNLEDLDPHLVLVIGGETAISDDVIDQIATSTGLTEVPLEPPPTSGIVRIAGADRYATAAAVADLADVYESAFAADDGRIAVAVGTIEDDLTVGTPNIDSVVWNDILMRWEVSFTNLSYFYNDYTTQVTHVGDQGYARTGSSGGDLLIYPFDADGDPVEARVAFTVFQPPAVPAP